MDIQRRFLTLPSGHQVHYRMAGSGPAMILMHSSPTSSAGLVRAIEAFSDLFTCIALDTPGYGISDDSVTDKDLLWGYADAVAQVLDVFGLDDAVIYGAATGAQIGVQFARKYPQRTRLLIMDSAGHFSKEDLAQIADGYFVDLTPRRDGTWFKPACPSMRATNKLGWWTNYTPSIAPRWDGRHLITAWAIMRDQSLFWPWFNQTKDGILWNDGAIDVALTHLRVLEMLKCGDRYQDAYKAMWTYPMRDKLPKLTIPRLLCHPPWEPVATTTHAADPRTLVEELPPAMADWHRVLDPFFAVS